MDKDSHNLFEKYFALQETSKRGMAAKKRKKAKKREAIEKNRKKYQSKSYSSDDIPNVPQDSNLNISYFGPETGEKTVGRGTGETPERQQLTQGQQGLVPYKDDDFIDVEGEVVDDTKPQPAPAPQPTPTPKPQPAPQPNTQSKPAPTPDVNQPSTFKNFLQRGKKGGLKGLEYAVKAVDPFSKQGLLGKAATAAKNAENWARSGAGDPYAAAKKHIKGTGGKLDIYDKKSGIEQQRAIQNYRNTYIYPRDKDINLNRGVANLFGKNVSVDPNTGEFIGLSNKKEQKAAGIPQYSDILKRRKPILNAAHLANIILDIFVDKFRQGVPPDKAYNDAFNSVGNPLIIDYLLKNKLLPKQ